MKLMPWLLILLLISCVGKNESKQSAPEELPASGLSGNELAKIHCSQCHRYVSPSYLSKTIWQKDVLPAMGHRLGIYEGKHQPDSLFGLNPQNRDIVEKAGIFPEKPVLAKADWLKIVEYYLQSAPDTIAAPVYETKINAGLKRFRYRAASFNHPPPLTTMVKILPNNRGIVFSDDKKKEKVLTYLTSDLTLDHHLFLNGSPISYIEKLDTIFLMSIGRNLFPNDLPHGAVQKIIHNDRDKSGENRRIILPNLQRPVAMTLGDLNNDKLADIVVCEYGDLTGKLIWYENKGNDAYEAHLLRSKPGSISAIIKDSNQDGLNDLFVLMAQGDEGIFFYENKGNNTFSEKRILSFIPLYGSMYMELIDFNADGFDDILYVCGDNADKTPILKEYHGIYIFLNDGQSNFDQTYFFHQNGAYKAIPRDYDHDGDLDIASISYFPDYLSRAEESFVYLENKGDLTFDPFTFPESTMGRWIVMDAGDMDADGDTDLALGSFVYFLARGDTTGLSQRWLRESPSVVVLENITK